MGGFFLSEPDRLEIIVPVQDTAAMVDPTIAVTKCEPSPTAEKYAMSQILARRDWRYCDNALSVQGPSCPVLRSQHPLQSDPVATNIHPRYQEPESLWVVISSFDLEQVPV